LIVERPALLTESAQDQLVVVEESTALHTVHRRGAHLLEVLGQVIQLFEEI
jgi:hypothetical protein